MTFADILNDCYRRLDLPSSPASAVVTRIKQYVNETHEALLSEPGLASLLYGTLTFASVADRSRYGVSSIAQIRAVTETTNDTTLRMQSLAWYRAVDPDPASNTSVPEVYVPLGIVALQRVPASTGTGLWVASSSGADTTQTTTIDAIRVDGYPHSPSAVTLTGTTRAQIGTLTDYVDVTQFQLSAACAGDVTLYDAAAAGNALAVIPRGQTTSRYWGFYLWPTPSGAITYTVDVEYELRALVNDTDEPLIPPRFHRLLAMGARMKEYEKARDVRYDVAAAEYAKGVTELKHAVTCPPEWRVIPNRRTRGRSRFGPHYPADRY